MTQPTQVTVSATGHIYQEVEQEEKGAGVAGENLVKGDIIYVKSTDSNKLWVYAGGKTSAEELSCSRIVGVCDDTYSAAAPCYYWKDAGVIPVGSGLTIPIGEVFVLADGSLGTFASVTVTHWTRRMGVGLATDSAQVSIGDVQQKEAV